MDIQDLRNEITKEFGIPESFFDGFKTIAELKKSCSGIPDVKGIYLVLRAAEKAPVIKSSSLGGYVHFPNDSPCYSVDELEDNYIDGSHIFYIGKSTNLRTRIRTYMRFGKGKRAGHGGGRAIWQLADADDLIVCWTATTDDSREVEKEMIQRYKLNHSGKRPFANMSD